MLYKIMIAHTELALGPLMCAKKAGVPMRICYSHNGRFALSLKRCFMDFETLFLKRYCTDMFAVSKLAARYTFGSRSVEAGEVKIIQNGIEMDDFRFHQETRDRIRKEYGLEDKLVVGQVGRFMTQKNQGFLLKVFAGMYHRRPDARLPQGLFQKGRGESMSEFHSNCRRLFDSPTRATASQFANSAVQGAFSKV